MNRVTTIAFLLTGFFLMPCAAEAQRRKQRPPVIRATVTVKGSPDSPTFRSPDKQRRQDAFDKTWTVLRDNYFDKTFNGLDWVRIRAEFQPRVTATKTDLAFHEVLEEMVERLGKSHTAIVPPEYFAILERAKEKSNRVEKPNSADAAEDLEIEETLFDDRKSRYGVGIELRLIDDEFVITRVEKGSVAESAGLKPGLIIINANGVSLTELMQSVLKEYRNPEKIRHHFGGHIISLLLNGEQDTEIILTVGDGEGPTRVIKIKRHLLAGELVSMGEDFPEDLLKFETGSLGPDVGYIRFSAFAIPVIAKFCQSLDRFSTKKALIIDLRGNSGGIIGTIMGLAGMLTDRTLSLGKSEYRHGSEELTAESKRKSFKGRLIFLVDGQSVSSAEIMAAGMQENGRAIIVGQRTAGEALPAVTLRLTTGAVLVYPIANFVTPKGRSLEGNGVEPDYLVTNSRAALLAGRDPQLEKALSLVNDNTAFAALDAAVPKVAFSSAGPPPPPAPKRAPQSTPLVVGPVAEAQKPEFPQEKDEKAFKAVSTFLIKIGGESNLRKVSSYEAKGRAAIGMMGSETDLAIEIARMGTDKFRLTLSSPAIGDVREIYNGTTAFTQSDFGVEQVMPTTAETTHSDFFAPIFRLLDPTYFKSLKLEGPYEMDGAKRTFAWGATARGQTVGLSFDAASGLLLTYSLPGVMYTFSDYRKVDGIFLPFKIDVNSGMKVQFETVKVNPKLNESSFLRKEMCFDRAN